MVSKRVKENKTHSFGHGITNAIPWGVPYYISRVQ